jgi:hypothetical protein
MLHPTTYPSFLCTTAYAAHVKQSRYYHIILIPSPYPNQNPKYTTPSSANRSEPIPDTTPKTPDVPKNRRLLNIAKTHVSFPRPLVAPTDEAFYVKECGRERSGCIYGQM